MILVNLHVLLKNHLHTLKENIMLNWRETCCIDLNLFITIQIVEKKTPLVDREIKVYYFV